MKINAVTYMNALRASDNNTRISIDANCIEESGLKAKISQFVEENLKKMVTQILLEDPDSDVKRMAEDYLIQCLYSATEDPEKNPILQKFFSNNRDEINHLINEVWEAKNEILQLKTELQALKDKLGINYSYNWNEDRGGVAWKNDIQGQFQYLESKLISITEKLGKAGIDINYWEN